MKQRYYFSKREDKYWVIDRKLDTRIAMCDYREQANLVVEALMHKVFWTNPRPMITKVPEDVESVHQAHEGAG